MLKIEKKHLESNNENHSYGHNPANQLYFIKKKAIVEQLYCVWPDLTVGFRLRECVCQDDILESRNAEN